jgi:ketosteroid isomerase-like protein
VAERYIEAMNAADLEQMLSLFRPDAVMRHMTGIYAGSEAIRGFFVEVAFGNAAHLERLALHAQDDIAWLEVEATSDVTQGRQRVVDVFRLDAEGRIADLGVYSGNTSKER